MNTTQLFGLTEEQLHIMYSLEYLIAAQDISLDKSHAALKSTWLQEWEAALNISQEDQISVPYKDKDAVIAAIRREGSDNPNKTWCYLVFLEAALFEPYYPLGSAPGLDQAFAKLHFSRRPEMLKRIAASSGIVGPEYIDRFIEAYKANMNKLTGKLQKVAITVISVVAVTAIAAATAGAAAGPIAVALFGSHFAGLSGAALTSACLAMAGGGAIAAGGAGMAGGTLAIVGGGALLGAASGSAAAAAVNTLVKSSPSFTLSQAAKLEIVMEEITLTTQKDVLNAQAIMASLRAQVAALNKQIADLKAAQKEDKETISNMEKSFQYLLKAYKYLAAFHSDFELKLLCDKMLHENEESSGGPSGGAS